MQKAEEIRMKAEEYFKSCDDTREKLTLKNGEVMYKQIPYTIAGLCAELEITKDTLINAYRKKPPVTKADKAYIWALSKVEQHIIERALLGELNASVAGLVLKEWAEEPKNENRAQPVRVVLEDPNGYAR